MKLVYNVYDDENQIESKQFDNFPKALEYAKQGLITYICEEDLDCPDCEERVVWTWDSTWNDEEAISNVECEKQNVEPCVEDSNDNIEITISGPAEEVESLIDLVFDRAFDLDWDSPVEETKVEDQDFADEFGYEDEPAAKDLDFDVENPFGDDLYNLEKDLGEDEFEIGDPEIVVDPAEESKEDQPKKLVEEAEDVEDEEFDDSELAMSDEEIEKVNEPFEENEPNGEEVEEILTSVEEIKEIAAEVGVEVAEVVKEDPEVEVEEIKEITDEIVEDKLEEQTEDELSDEEPEELEEATHAQYAKPEGDRVAAYNNALKYAKKNNADYIYGYTNHSGKFFALEQPIKMSEKIGETEKEFRNKYKNCSTVYVAYRDKDFVESIELEETDNAVVDCKIADVITHSEDEKPLNEAIKMTKDELLDKEGTTDVDLINAGRPEEKRVELVESEDFYQPDRELVGYVIVDTKYSEKCKSVYLKKGWEEFSQSYYDSYDDVWYDQIITEDLDEVELYDTVEKALDALEDFYGGYTSYCTKISGKNSLLINWAGDLDWNREKWEVDEYIVKPLYHCTQSWNELDEQLKENCKIDESRLEDTENDLAESVSQEISNAYRQLSKAYGKDIEELVYGPTGFMATKYPNGLPDFRGDIIYSDKYWAEFEEWLEYKEWCETHEQIEENLDDDLTDQEFAEQLQARLQEADVKSTAIDRPEAPKDLSVVKEPGDPSISEGDLVWFNTRKGEDVVVKIIKFTKDSEGNRNGCRVVYTEPRVTRPHKDTYTSQYFGNK